MAGPLGLALSRAVWPLHRPGTDMQPPRTAATLCRRQAGPGYSVGTGNCSTRGPHRDQIWGKDEHSPSDLWAERRLVPKPLAPCSQ